MDDKNKIVEELYLNGRSIKKVAAELLIGRNYIYLYLKKKGLMRTQSASAGLKWLSDTHKQHISDSIRCSDKYKLSQKNRRIQPKAGWMVAAPALYYILGVMAGDGYLMKNAIGLESKDKDFIDAFSQALIDQFGIVPHIYNRKAKIFVDYRNDKTYLTKPTFILRLFSTEIMEFLRAYRSGLDNIPNELAINWVRGFWDSEGHIGYQRSGYAQQIAVTQRDKTILDIYSALLKQTLGIKTNTIKSSYQEIYRCYFGRQESIKKFFEIIKPSIKRKTLYRQASIKNGG